VDTAGKNTILHHPVQRKLPLPDGLAVRPPLAAAAPQSLKNGQESLGIPEEKTGNFSDRLTSEDLMVVIDGNQEEVTRPNLYRARKLFRPGIFTYSRRVNKPYPGPEAAFFLRENYRFRAELGIGFSPMSLDFGLGVNLFLTIEDALQPNF